VTVQEHIWSDVLALAERPEKAVLVLCNIDYTLSSEIVWVGGELDQFTGNQMIGLKRHAQLSAER